MAQAIASGGAGQNGELPFIQCGKRREYKDWFKAQVVQECMAPGSSVSIVARRYDINRREGDKSRQSDAHLAACATKVPAERRGMAACLRDLSDRPRRPAG